MRVVFYVLIFFFPVFIGAQQTSTFYKYILHKPTDTISPKPLILFLHGSGESGDNLDLLKVHGPLKYLSNSNENDIDAYILVPQCPTDQYWETTLLFELLEKVVADNKVDRNKIHFTGLSMGAWGIWNLAITHPEIPASLVAIAGFVDRIPMIEICKLENIQVRIFHGKQDDVVDVFYSQQIFNRLKKCSDKVDLQIFEDANHDSWTRVYDNAEIYQWMISKKKE
jgi:predicted peptidase